MLTKEQVVEYLEETQALLSGHFLLTSGRHSDKYFQCARLFQQSKYSEALCAELAELYKDAGVDVVVGPAVGAIIMTYEVSRHLGTPNMFTERDSDGKMVLRRSFTIEPGTKVLVVEDVVTTGGTVREVIDLVRAHGGTVVGVGSIVDRTNGKTVFDVPYKAVLSMEVNSFEAADCPLCKQGLDVVKPGSRNIK